MQQSGSSLSDGTPWSMLQPVDNDVEARHGQIGADFDPFGTPSNDTLTMGCAPGRRSSPFQLFGAFYGILDAYLEQSIEICHQLLHQVTLRRSPVISRPCSRFRIFLTPSGCGRASPRAPTAPEARTGALFSKFSPINTVEAFKALRNVAAVGLGDCQIGAATAAAGHRVSARSA